MSERVGLADHRNSLEYVGVGHENPCERFEAADGCETFELLGEQIAVRTPGVGKFRVVDFVVENRKTGERFIIEVKTGKGTRNASQVAKDRLIADPDAPTAFFGKNAQNDLGITSETLTGKLRTIEINADNVRRLQ